MDPLTGYTVVGVAASGAAGFLLGRDWLGRRDRRLRAGGPGRCALPTGRGLLRGWNGGFATASCRSGPWPEGSCAMERRPGGPTAR